MPPFNFPGEPKSLLGYYRQLSPSAAVKVSPLCLGAMNFGTAWEEFMGPLSKGKETAFEMLDYFKDMGGNFIDTANNYQNEESEAWIGEWMAARKNRDELVLATKFTTAWQAYKGHDKIIQSNFGGNNKKSLVLSVKDSLKKLQTDYIDILYIHWWDYTTSIPELMDSLDELVKQGKVLYLAVSDSPAWVVSKANEYARQRGKSQFVVYQGLWSAATRDFEREIIPMCRHEGMALAPWGALGGGKFKSEADRNSSNKEGRIGDASETQIAVSKVLEKIAKKKNTVITSVALAYVMHKTPYVFPIVGGRKVDHLKGNIEALGLELTTEDMKEIESAAPFAKGFPYDTFSTKEDHTEISAGDVWIAHMAGHVDYVENSKPIPATKHQK